MFTGIVTDMGEILELETLASGIKLKIKTNYDPKSIDIGASIACAGTCLTVTGLSDDQSGASWFTVEAWEEALRLTTIGELKVGDRINLERALKMGDELGGHIVSGHVDGRATIVDIVPEGDAKRFLFEISDECAPYIAPKGSVTLDGTSLTINQVNGNRFDVLIIRHTMDVTSWGQSQVGDLVNLEVDQMARQVALHVARLLALKS